MGIKHKEIPADPDTDIKAILSYLKDVHYDVEKLQMMLMKLRKLRLEAKMLTDDEARKESVRKQIELYDELLLRYEYYDNDADINGIRVKNIAKYYFEEARKYKFYDLIEKIKKEARWFFDW